MPISLEVLLLITGILLIFSILASKVADWLGVPALLAFLVLGMLAGSDGPGRIYFDDPAAAQALGVIALVFILFSGGMNTEWQRVRPVLRQGLLLSTVGVFLTALLVALFLQAVLGLSFWTSFLIGAIISSTDTAAVFSILRARKVNLSGKLEQILELESGSNDPLAIFLTTQAILFLTQPQTEASQIFMALLLQITVGVIFGFLAGWLIPRVINRLDLGYAGLYSVVTISLALLTFATANLLGGNGFLAVYLAGILAGRQVFIHKRSLIRFHDSFAWLMQIAMFVVLGLLVFPSRLPVVAGEGLLVALFLMLVARPLSVFLTLLGSRLNWREQAMIAWVGLRGAVPIILATYPLMAGIPEAGLIFNLVFFVVLISVLLQGTSVMAVARRLRVDLPGSKQRSLPVEFDPVRGFTPAVHELILPAGAPIIGRTIIEAELPDEFLIVLVGRGDEYVIPYGKTQFQVGDHLLVLAEEDIFESVRAHFLGG